MFSISTSFFIWVVIAVAAALAAASHSLGRLGTDHSNRSSLTDRGRRLDAARFTLGVGMAVSYLAATWFALDFGAPVKVASAVASVMLIAYCFHSGRQVISAWGLLDLLIGGLMVWHIAVDTTHQGFSIGLVARAYGEWVLPYAAGRYAVMHRQSIAKLSPWFIAVAAIIGFLAIAETFSRVNFWETLFHSVDDDVRRSHSVRYGWLYRAIGPTRHPIFLAVVMMTMIPWVIGFWESRRLEPRRWLGTGLGAAGIAMGIVASGSRAPLFALAAAVCFAIAVKHKLARWVLGVAVIVAGFVFVSQFDRVTELLDTNLREKNLGTIVMVDGKAEVHTGSLNRMYVAQIYGPLVIRGGPIGYGTQRTSTFPPDVPGLPAEADSRERLGIVDNSYILLGLRFGWVGVGLFTALLITSIVMALSLRRSASMYLKPNGDTFVTAVACTLFALSIEIVTVFLHYDMGFWLLFLIGTVAGIKAYSVRAMRGKELTD